MRFIAEYNTQQSKWIVTVEAQKNEIAKTQNQLQVYGMLLTLIQYGILHRMWSRLFRWISILMRLRMLIAHWHYLDINVYHQIWNWRNQSVSPVCVCVCEFVRHVKRSRWTITGLQLTFSSSLIHLLNKPLTIDVSTFSYKLLPSSHASFISLAHCIPTMIFLIRVQTGNFMLIIIFISI